MRTSSWHSWVAIVAMTLLMTISCSDGPGDDTCSGGDTMSDPVVADDFDATAAAPTLKLTWDQGSGRGGELPAAYFDDVMVAPETDAAVRALISSVQHSAAREILVSFGSLTTFLMSESVLAFTLELPDRRSVLDCSHPGMADRYLLDVSLSFDSSGAMVDQQLTQRVQLGAI